MPFPRQQIGVNVLDDARRDILARQLRRELSGALITEVVPESPAAAAGLRAMARGGWERPVAQLGDLITHVNGQPVRSNEDLLCGVEETPTGEAVEFTVMRNCNKARIEKLRITPVPRSALRTGAAPAKQGPRLGGRSRSPFPPQFPLRPR